MRTAVVWLYLLALIVWLGETVFLSFVVAPSIFRGFPPEEAGRVMGTIFPAYYAVGIVCGVVLVGAAVFLWRTGSAGAARWGLAAALAVVMLVCILYAGFAVQPRVRELRELRHRPDAPANVEADFQHLHGLSVQLNSVVLAGGIALSVLAAMAVRRAER
jgi:cytochrome bd-type quinol oxidase subunit 2